MLIIPAIDLKEGRCVRLRQGRAGDCKVYSENPVDMAKHWANEGAECLHVVDLDGAFQGKPVHSRVIADIIKAADVPIEVGGGLRTNDDIRAVLELGAERAIIGTRAFTESGMLSDLVSEFGPRLAVGIDSTDGFVRVRGWVEQTSDKVLDLAVLADKAGVKTIICTDIATDGMMSGPNVRVMEEICQRVSCDVIASGGITTIEDIIALKNLNRRNLIGAIVGKALYEKGIALRDLLKVASP